jgi:hypothetical protein
VDHVTLNTDVAPDAVTNFASVGTDNQVALSWTNPASSNYTGTMIRFSTTGYPLSPTDGTILCDRAAAPGSSDNYTHTGISGSMYYYAAFAHDASAHYSSPVYTSGSPHTITNTVYDNGGNPWPIPGRIEAEYYDNGGQDVAYHTTAGEPAHSFRSTESVFVENTGDSSGTYNIGFIDTGEWWKYTVNVGATGAYQFVMRVASPNTGGQFRIEVDGVDTTGALTAPNTGNWQIYTDVQSAPVTLTAGNHVLRVYVVNGGWNFNYLNVISSICVPPSINSQPASQGACAGTTATFAVAATGTGITYQWRKNGVNISNGATGNGSSYANCATNSLSITNTQLGDSAVAGVGFDCVVSGTCGSATSNRVALTVGNCQTVTIQRGTYGTVRDDVLCGDPDKVDYNSGAASGDVRLYPDVNYASGKGPRHLLVGFDLSTIPSGSTISSATLGLYLSNNGPTITGYRLSRLRPGRDWIEGTGMQGPASVNEPTWNCRKAGSPASNCNATWGSLGGANTSSDVDDTTSLVWNQVNGTSDAYKTFNVTNWVNDWVNNSGAWPNNGMITWGGSAPGTNNVYWRVATSEDASNRPYLTVAYIVTCTAPAITAQPVSMVKSAGANASFSVTATGTGLTYQWKKGSSNIGLATSSTYSITGVAAGDSASYTCVVTGTCGSVTSSAAVLTVLTSDGSIATAKTLADNTPVQLGNKDLYLKWPGFAYIEEPTLFSGIRVQGALTSAGGDRICLAGNLMKPAGAEPYIQVTTMTRADAATVVPVAASNFAVGRSLMDGFYVTVFGRVKTGSIVGNSYVITDGSDDTGIKIITQSAPGVTDGQYVWVTGAAGYDGGRIVYKK